MLVTVTLTLGSLWVKFSSDDILKYFSYFSQKTGFDISCMKCQILFSGMKCQILFSGKSKKNITTLSSAELAQSVVKVKSEIININAIHLKHVSQKKGLETSFKFSPKGESLRKYQALYLGKNTIPLICYLLISPTAC